MRMILVKYHVMTLCVLHNVYNLLIYAQYHIDNMENNLDLVHAHKSEAE